MLTVEGTYKNGKIELSEQPAQIQEARVLVTFLEVRPVNLEERGIYPAQAQDLRDRLHTFAEDWNRPEASIYDENPPR